MMHVLTISDGETARDVRLIDLYPLRRGSVVSETLDLLADLADERADGQKRLRVIDEQRKDGKVSTDRAAATITSVLAKLERRQWGIWGSMLSSLLHDPPPAPSGDLTPYDRGYAVVEGLVEAGWTLGEIDQAAASILADADAARRETSENKLKGRIHRTLGFSEPQPAS